MMTTPNLTTSNRKSIISAALFCSAFFANSASASDAIGPGDSDSKWVLGLHAGSYNNPFKGENNENFVFPNIEYRGERLFFKDGEFGYRLYSESGFSVGALLTANESFLSDDEDYKKNQYLAGLNERDFTLDMGLYFMHRTELGRLKLALLDEITGEHGGQSANIDYTFDLAYRNWSINPFVGASWMSRDSVDHFFGVSVAEANANRAAYDGKSAVNLFTGIRGRYNITENWDINLAAAYVHLGSGIEKSSLIEDNSAFGGTVGINYNF